MKRGLYDPMAEHDSCGVGFVADIKNRCSHDLVLKGLEILSKLEHRGAAGANPTTGDGAGLLTHIPDGLFRDVMSVTGVKLPPKGKYGVGMMFFPQDSSQVSQILEVVERIVAEEGLVTLGWRDVPTNNANLNEEVKASEPSVRQVFVASATQEDISQSDLERKLYVARRRLDHALTTADSWYCVSFSSRTIVYKGMFLANQLEPYYPDLSDKRFTTALAVVHQRFSTNTFPAWKLAHPYRMIAHNGEINTHRGNINNMLARQGNLSSSVFGADIAKILPLVDEEQSDSATIDNALELLCMAGHTIQHAMAILIPEAWQGNGKMDSKRRSFYQYHAGMMEPWDGPAAVVFTDGLRIGATLDRNGLRPARYVLTEQGLIVMASEVGVLDIPDDKIAKKWRLEPGKMLLVDLEAGELIDDVDIKEQLSDEKPYSQWVEHHQICLEDLPDCSVSSEDMGASEQGRLVDLQRAFGYTEEAKKFIIQPMLEDGQEPIGSMGDDAPQAILSSRSRSLFDYFRQEFSQVTNPAIDPIREEMVMSLMSYLGVHPSILSPEAEPADPLVVLPSPILTKTEISKLKNINEFSDNRLIAKTLDVTYPVDAGKAGFNVALESLCEMAVGSVNSGVNILILSDKNVGSDRIAIPILLAISAVHHHLVSAGTRAHTGLVAETGAAYAVHHFAALAGFGAEGIYPYLAFKTVKDLAAKGKTDEQSCIESYCKAIGKGLRKVMSKMGVSTYQSYCGAQLFEIIGIRSEVVDRYFSRTTSQIEGIGLDEIADDALEWHQSAFGESRVWLHDNSLDAGGDYAYRTRGEAHMWTPAAIQNLQHAVRSNNLSNYQEYSRLINDQNEQLLTLRGLLDFKDAPSVPLDEVEPAADIVRRFSTGAMSFGSISLEAHTVLAIAMNRLKGKSNTGEGGEDPERFKPMANGDSMCSAIKQVASGRFGVTAEYLRNSNMMQIKIAQGAKPGEGGQLPGHKVDENIARVRYSVPGVGLISPPPHHDIYSIEDIAQLIYDLKNVNPAGDVSVKLVSRHGVGTVAAGVAKAKSDHITIAGHDGGTGASPLSSIKHAGTPWELGLSETHQTLLLNDLRGRVALQVDGQIKTGRDVVIGALLGADEFGFATAPLVAEGCVMMRKCHLNTCPVGIATQNPILRQKFSGTPEHVVNYFFFVAEEVRELMAALGFRRFDELVGRSDMLFSRKNIQHPKAQMLDLSALLYSPDVSSSHARHHCQRQNHELDKNLDNHLIEEASNAVNDGSPTEIHAKVTNADRSVGAMLSGVLVEKYGHAGLPEDTIKVRLSGIAGQSFGAFLAHGITLDLVGEANDYVGKGLSGGIISVRPPASKRADGENIIVGNVVLYGATSGEGYFRGVAGERFAVRNSGAQAVVEGSGDHCCEYMTGGTVVVIGPVGRNFAAGMSGGVAYVLDEKGFFPDLCNLSMVSLEPLGSSIGDDQHMGCSDIEIVQELLTKHFKRTGSSKAERILKEWDDWAPKFVKVMPHEYRRALLELSRDGKEAA